MNGDKPIDPYFSCEAPNAPIVLRTGSLTLAQGNHSEETPIDPLVFQWVPHAAIVGEFESRLFRLGVLDVTGTDQTLRADFEVFRSGAERGFWSLDDVSIVRSKSKDPSLAFADIHVPNIPQLIGLPISKDGTTIYGRQTFEFGDWTLTMDPIFLARKMEKTTRAICGNCLTHVIRATRLDGKPFRLKHVTKLLEDLWLALSFIIGDHLGPCLTVGRDSNGTPIAELIQPSLGFGWRLRAGVAPKRSGVGPMLTKLAQLFRTKRTIITETIFWYIEARWGLPEASVVLAQAALERLSFNYLVSETGLLTEEGFERLTAADSIRLTMRSLQVPIEVPNSRLDAPTLITRSRNQQVHPKPRGDNVPIDQSRSVALSAIELIILRLAGYQGAYHPTAAFNQAEETGVPWGPSIPS